MYNENIKIQKIFKAHISRDEIHREALYYVLKRSQIGSHFSLKYSLI